MSDPQAQGLTPADQQALDALLEAGFELEHVSANLRDRAGRIGQLLGLLDALPEPSAGDLLVERTLTAVAQTRQTETAAAATDGGLDAGHGLSIRWRDLTAVAAMLLITMSLALPMLNQNKHQARLLACQANLATAGMGFGRYAGDHGGALPSVEAHTGDTWWDTNAFNKDGSTRSNSAHYYLLIRTGYVTADRMACASDPNKPRVVRITTNVRDFADRESIPFSYANLFAQHKPTWTGPKRVILVDRNPLFVTTDKGKLAPSATDVLSPRHAELGVQNTLFNDGSVIAMDAPTLDDGDNIWHLQDHDGAYTGNEIPLDELDDFLVP
jgi:hypothetical protein